jgi:hypothetical protein
MIMEPAHGVDEGSAREAPLAVVRLLLASNAGFPEGSSTRGYELRLPLMPDGQIDRRAAASRPDACTVLRFWEGEPDRHGHLVHGPMGWCIEYGPKEQDGEPMHRFEASTLRPGDYASVHEHDGLVMQFRIVGVQ